MRIALLSTKSDGVEEGAANPAFTKFAGASVIEHQIDTAVAMECDAVFCIVDQTSPTLERVRQSAEQSAVPFRKLVRPEQLVEAVSRDDEVLLIARGVLPDKSAVLAQLGNEPSIAGFASSTPLSPAFERLSRDVQWAGVATITGADIEALSEFPEDIDIHSTLVRIALQNGADLVRLPPELVDNARWHWAADRNALKEREAALVEAKRRAISFRAPGLAIAERIAAKLARDLLGRPLHIIASLTVMICLVGALLCAWVDMPSVGFLLICLAALAGEVAALSQRVDRKVPRLSSIIPDKFTRTALMDGVLILLLAAASPFEGLARWFVPVVLIGLLRLGSQHASDAWRDTYQDRILLSSILACAAIMNWSHHAAMLVSLLALASRFFPQFRKG